MTDKKARETPPDGFTIQFCPECGHDDLYRPLKTRHFAGGRLCGGVPFEVRYARVSGDVDGDAPIGGKE